MTVRHTLPHLTAAKVASDHPAKNKNRSRGVFFFVVALGQLSGRDGDHYVVT